MARILAVDEWAEIARLHQAALEIDGHTVTMATDISGAWTLFETVSFDLVIIGGMAGKAGELSRKIREKNPYMPVIIFAGIQPVPHYANRFIQKPGSVREIIDTVNELLKT